MQEAGCGCLGVRLSQRSLPRALVRQRCTAQTAPAAPRFIRPGYYRGKRLTLLCQNQVVSSNPLDISRNSPFQIFQKHRNEVPSSPTVLSEWDCMYRQGLASHSLIVLGCQLIAPLDTMYTSMTLNSLSPLRWAHTK